MNGWVAKEAIPRPWPWDVMRWRARRSSHPLDLQCGAESALLPATSDRRAIRSPNINPRRPSQIRGASLLAPPISPFKADNKSPAEIPIATASPHSPLPQSLGCQSTNPVLILQQGDDWRDATVPNASPSLVSADMGFHQLLESHCFYCLSARHKTHVLTAILGQGPNYLAISIHFSLIFPD